MSIIRLLFGYCSVLIVTVSADRSNDTRLAFRAERANQYEFPYQVSIQMYRNHHCGGSLISRTHVLTAAHCVNEAIASPARARFMTVEVGSTIIGRGSTYDVKRLSYYKQYDGNLYGRFAHPRDIAVITLKTPILESVNVRTISLPPANYQVSVGQPVTISGWGNARMNGPGSAVLQKSTMYVVSNYECNQYYSNYLRRTIIDAQICCKAGFGFGTCQGDSGSPLVYGNIVVGVVSSGDGHCGAGNPDLYTKVSSFIPYIQYELNYDFSYESYSSPAISLNLDHQNFYRKPTFYPWRNYFHQFGKR